MRRETRERIWQQAKGRPQFLWREDGVLTMLAVSLLLTAWSGYPGPKSAAFAFFGLLAGMRIQERRLERRIEALTALLEHPQNPPS